MQKLMYSPTLNTVLMVEETLKAMPGSVMTVAALKRALPRQVNHNALLHVLEYLQASGKILLTVRGITWVHNVDPRLAAAIAWSASSTQKKR